MNSPVDFPYESFIVINRSSDLPVYLQISNQFINAIQRGLIPFGTKLAGTRSLSILLNIHRNTVTAVYDELFAQGWVEVIPNKGTFVIGKEQNESSGVISFEKKQLENYPISTGFTFKTSNILDNPFDHSECEFAFSDGIPDIRLTQIDHHSRMYSTTLKRKAHKMGHYNHDGSEFFKENLSRYLNLSRGLPISKKNLLITRSTEMSIYIVSEILLSPGDTVLVGELSYFSVNMIFQKAGVNIQTIPIDEDGINIEEVRKICSRQKIRMLYITPHHHYPTTVTLSAQRRLELLQLANEYGFIILEDDYDYDYDFNYDKSPILPLAGADTNGMVIYIGSFGKSLVPGFRTGFIVAPENLMTEMRKYLGIIDRQGDVLMEHVLGEMIAEGEINRYLKKSIKIYRQRRDYFTQLLNENLGEYIDFQKPSGGLAVWIEWKIPFNLMQLSRTCGQNNLFIPKTLLYQNKHLTAMRLGFGNLNKEEADKSMEILSDNVRLIL